MLRASATKHRLWRSVFAAMNLPRMMKEFNSLHSLVKVISKGLIRETGETQIALDGHNIALGKMMESASLPAMGLEYL